MVTGLEESSAPEWSERPREPERHRPRHVLTAVLAAAIVAVAVLGLFLRLQEYGPESALRKFHQAIAGGSLTDLQKVTIEDVRNPDVQRFAAQVGGLMARGGNRFRILRTDRTPNQVRAVVAYQVPVPPGGMYYRVWIMDRRGRAWRVNVDATQRFRQDVLGVGP